MGVFDCVEGRFAIRVDALCICRVDTLVARLGMAIIEGQKRSPPSLYGIVKSQSRYTD